MKKGFIIAGIALVVTGMLVFLFVLIASGFNPAAFGGGSMRTETYAVTEDFDRIEIRLKETDLTIKRAEDGKCTADCVMPEKIDYEVFTEEGTLKIRVSDQRRWFDHLKLSFVPCEMVLSLPKEYYESLNVQSGSGKVNINEGFEFEEASVKTGTGAITLDKTAGKELMLSVSTGRIHTLGVESENLTLIVSTGDAELRDTSCKSLTTSGSTGKFTLKNAAIHGPLSIVRSTGDVLLENVSAERITAELSTGDLCFANSDAFFIHVETSTGDVTGTLRSAKTFDVKTSTGKVNLPPTGNGGNCEIRTTTGNVDLSLN